MQLAILCLSRGTSLGPRRSQSVCLPLGFIVCNTHLKKKKLKKKVNESKCVKPCYWAFSCWFPGFSVAAVTFKKLLIQKMNTVEKGSPKFMSQTHTCCRWQMLCCRAKEGFFFSFLWGWYCVLLTWGMQLFCPWSVPVSHLHYYISERLKFSLWQSMQMEWESERGEERRGKRAESRTVCFSHRSHGRVSSAH